MKIRVTVCNTIPTQHAHRLIQPKIEIEDDVLPNEIPMEAYRRISLTANAVFAREVLDQLRFTDRMAHTTNEQWCDEFLSTVAEDHPAMNVVVNPESLPAGVQAMAQAFGDAIASFTVARLQELLKEQQTVPPAGD